MKKKSFIQVDFFIVVIFKLRFCHSVKILLHYFDRQKDFDRGRKLVTVEVKVRMTTKSQSATDPVEQE